MIFFLKSQDLLCASFHFESHVYGRNWDCQCQKSKSLKLHHIIFFLEFPLHRTSCLTPSSVLSINDMCFVLINISWLSHVLLSLPQHVLLIYLFFLPPLYVYPSIHAPCLVPTFPPCLLLCSSSLALSHHLSSIPQSVIVKSVERNAVNMYEARKFLLGLESNGVSSSSPPVVLNPTHNGPSPSLICPVGLDILASAGLGLSSLGNGSSQGFYLHHYQVHTLKGCWAKKGLYTKNITLRHQHVILVNMTVCFLLLWRWTAGMLNIQTSWALITIPIFAVIGNVCPVCLWIELLFKMILALETGAPSNPE